MRIQLCSEAFALLQVPSRTRAAIHLSGKVVSRLIRTAMTGLPGSFFGRDAKSPSHHIKRLKASSLRSVES
jgi:hypothetical protein